MMNKDLNSTYQELYYALFSIKDYKLAQQFSEYILYSIADFKIIDIFRNEIDSYIKKLKPDSEIDFDYFFNILDLIVESDEDIDYKAFNEFLIKMTNKAYDLGYDLERLLNEPEELYYEEY